MKQGPDPRDFGPATAHVAREVRDILKWSRKEYAALRAAGTPESPTDIAVQRLAVFFVDWMVQAEERVQQETLKDVTEIAQNPPEPEFGRRDFITETLDVESIRMLIDMGAPGSASEIIRDFANRAGQTATWDAVAYQAILALAVSLVEVSEIVADIRKGELVLDGQA